MTGDMELVDSVTGHYDVVYGTFDPRYLTWYVPNQIENCDVLVFLYFIS